MRYYIVLTLLAIISSCSENCSKDSFNEEAIRLNNKGLKFHLMTQFDSAIVYYNQAIEVDPCYYLPHSNLAGVYNAKKDYDNALKQVNIAVEKKPDLSEGWMLSGMLHSLKGQTEKANNSYQKSINLYEGKLNSLDSSSRNMANEVKFNLAIVCILSGKDSIGRKHLVDLAKENPNSGKYKKALKYDKDDWLESILGVNKSKEKEE